jgi:hypothetical protein
MNQHLRRFVAFCLCFGFVAVHHPAPTGAQSDDVIVDVESYAVFAAALATSGLEAVDRVAVLQETRAITTCPAEEAVPPEWQPVVTSHKKENAVVRTLRSGADLGRPYSIVSIGDLRSRMRAAGYDLSTFSGQQSPGAKIFRSLPGGRLVAFSAVGFDERKTRAMVTVLFDCFPTAENQPPYQSCREYQQLMLEKQKGKWVAVRSAGSCGGIA